MPLLNHMLKMIRPQDASQAAVPRSHVGDEIYLAETETRSRDVDLAILRALCS